MTPQNKTQNLMLWAAALGVAILLSFLGALAQQLPGDDPIRWRQVWLNVIQTILTTAPIVAAGFGLPRLGKEGVASLVSEVGTENAKAALEGEADRQAGAGAPALSDEDIDRLAHRGIELMREQRVTEVAGRG